MGERAARLTCLALPPPEAPKSTIPMPGGSSVDVVAEEKEKEEKEEKKEGKGDEEKDVQSLVAIPMTFLFKMQHSHEADQFIKHINGFLEKSKKEE